MNIWYKLNEKKEVVPATQDEAMEVWRDFDRHRRVAYDQTPQGFAVSTVFLALDHGFGGRGMFFETMIVDGSGPLVGYQERYATWDQAVAGHARALARVRRPRWLNWTFHYVEEIREWISWKTWKLRRRWGAIIKV